MSCDSFQIVEHSHKKGRHLGQAEALDQPLLMEEGVLVDQLLVALTFDLHMTEEMLACDRLLDRLEQDGKTRLTKAASRATWAGVAYETLAA